VSATDDVRARGEQARREQTLPCGGLDPVWTSIEKRGNLSEAG
jgi:hypothetical protein